MATATSRREWQEALVLRLIARHQSQDPETIIERYAGQLRERAGQTKLPIQVDQISSLVGIRRRTGRYDFAGRIYAAEGGQLVLDLNTEDTPARQVFTEAHELMHTAFPGFKKEKRFRLEPTAERHPPNREEEYLCDYGAAALLMPAELVDGRFSIKNGLRDAERLARSARVSLEAAANRLVSLSDEPAILLCLGWSHKPANRAALRRGEEVEKRLRVRYAFSRHLDAYVPRFKGADDESVFCKAAYASQIKQAVETLPGSPHAGLFRLQAKCYGADKLQRVLALGRPTV